MNFDLHFTEVADQAPSHYILQYSAASVLIHTTKVMSSSFHHFLNKIIPSDEYNVLKLLHEALISFLLNFKQQYCDQNNSYYFVDA